MKDILNIHWATTSSYGILYALFMKGLYFETPLFSLSHLCDMIGIGTYFKIKHDVLVDCEIMMGPGEAKT